MQTANIGIIVSKELIFIVDTNKANYSDIEYMEQETIKWTKFQNEKKMSIDFNFINKN
jgi:hypothetical protein